MEVGEISRFKTPGQFASYCRTVDSRRMSNGKKKGENNRKCGNRYLAWAFVEAANFAKRHDDHCRRWFDRKAATNQHGHRDQGAGLQTGQGRLARDESGQRLRSEANVSRSWQARRRN